MEMEGRYSIAVLVVLDLSSLGSLDALREIQSRGDQLPTENKRNISLMHYYLHSW